jgi:hypothetical protein
MENVTDLKRLIEEYELAIQRCEQEIIDKKRKQNIARQALELLIQEGVTNVEMPQTRANRLLEGLDLSVGLGSALRKIFNSWPDEFLSAQDIYDQLVKNGFHSKSANIKRDVYVRLYKMEKTRTLESKEQEGIKKYRLRKGVTQEK